MDNVFGCRTVQDVHAFIIEHLRNRCCQPTEIINDEPWIIVAGFRIDDAYNVSHCHNVYVHENTREYAVHDSAVNLYTNRHVGFPNLGRYPTYQDMMVGFVNAYAQRWNIGKDTDTAKDTAKFLSDMDALEASIVDGRRACPDLLEIRCNFKHKRCHIRPSYTDSHGHYFCSVHAIMVQYDIYK